MRHKWIEDNSLCPDFPGTYKISKCTKCGCLRLHLFLGNVFSKQFVQLGITAEKTPECSDNCHLRTPCKILFMHAKSINNCNHCNPVT